MRIRERSTRGVSTASTGPAKAKSSPTAAEAPRSSQGASDSVLVSDRGLEVQRARGLAIEAPDIREALVGEVSEQIESGQYAVTGEDVAPKMIHEHLTEAAR
ncbi:MAG: flagellar biosynthesis anti-sigma factor FlgM [Deltaproteobacteria bacterium]|nr:flagellar biosynthesis anti-sigma factor FlgM [Deltaproteobacteria bacterium]